MQNGEASQKACFEAASSSSLQESKRMLIFSGEIDLRASLQEESSTKPGRTLRWF
jgi:hypothetical protein